MSNSAWSLTAEQRQETTRRTSENLFTLAYSRGQQLGDKEAASAAAQLEDKAYTVAQVESQTTTGHRPHEECLKAYIRKLAALLIEWVAEDRGSQRLTEAATDEVVELSGGREFLTKAGAEAALAALLSGRSSVKRVKLSTKSFGLTPDNSAEVAARAFRASAASLTDVDLSDVIAGRPEAEALAALATMSRALGELGLRRLDLSDNALGEKGVRACAPAFAEQEGLEFLAFQNVGCSINACAAVRDLLRHASRLTGLHFYNNMSDNEGAASIAQVLSRAQSIEDFKMASSRVGGPGGIALAKGLQAGRSLLRLDLSDNPMTSEAAEDIARLVAAQPRLLALNLNDTSLGDEGISKICTGLSRGAEDLEELELALNEITPASAKDVAGVIASKRRLRKLNLRENELEDLGACRLAAGLQASSALQVLDLTQNQIRRAGAVAVARAVAHCDGLTLLALDENEISEAGIEALKDTLKDANLLEALGPLDENDPDAVEDDDEAEDEEAESPGGAGDDKDENELVKALQTSQIS